MTTKNDLRDPAVVCREHGWGAGTRLVGDEGQGPTVIEITAVGERMILAKQIRHDGAEETSSEEGVWVLVCRDWRVCT